MYIITFNLPYVLGGLTKNSTLPLFWGCACRACRVPPLRATVRLRLDITKQSRRYTTFHSPVSQRPNGCTWWRQVMCKTTPPLLCPWRTIKNLYSTSVLGRCLPSPPRVATSHYWCVRISSPYYNQHYTDSANASTHTQRAKKRFRPWLSHEHMTTSFRHLHTLTYQIRLPLI